MVFNLITFDYFSKHQSVILNYGIKVGETFEKFRLGIAANFSVVGGELIFTRKLTKYIYEYYIPSGLFVVVSWV